MCGLAGFIDYQKKNDENILTKMINSQYHRGPDADGLILFNLTKAHVGLAHRRLTILDNSTLANQPMHYEHLTLIYNGEIYNFKTIREKLIGKGYVFHTQSDTEVVLKAWHAEGLEAVTQFRGMFAFVIFDKKLNKLFIVKDRAGVKPIYYFHHHNHFVFASELKAFRYYPNCDLSLSPIGLSLYFQYGYIPSPHAIFNHTFKLMPGHYLTFDLEQNTFTTSSYWELEKYYQKPKLSLTELEARTTLTHLLEESCELRMIADVPVGILLSGGMDSSLIATLLTKLNYPLKTFTLGFHETNYNEAPYAKAIAKYLNTDHYEHYCHLSDIKNLIPQLPYFYDEPFADDSTLPTLLISQFAKKEVSVILSGEGGDELFGGYPVYELNWHRFNALQQLPLPLINFFLKNLIKIKSFYRFFPKIYHYIFKLLDVLQSKTIAEKHHVLQRIFNSDELNHFLGQKPHRLNPSYSAMHDIETMMLADFNQYLPDNLMVKMDRATMHFSLEGREPLLDHTLLEFTAQLPLNFKMNKYLLKKMLAEILPFDLFARKKQGFGIPINSWLKNELSYLRHQYLEKNCILRQGIFDANYCAMLNKQLQKGSVKNHKTWTLIVFQLWYEKYFNFSF